MAQGTLMPERDTAILCRELISVSDWRSLGLNLGVRDYELDQIQSSHPTEGCSRWRQETISLWLRHTPSASWENVVRALQMMGENTLAVRIHQTYIGGTPCPPISPGTSTGGYAGPLFSPVFSPVLSPSTISPMENMSKYSVFVHENRQAINDKFFDLQMKVCERLENGVDIKKFWLFVKNQFRPGYCIPPLPTTLMEIFEAITRNGLWDYFHYTPLASIVKRYGVGDTEMEDWIQTYRKDLRSYLLLAKVKDFFQPEPDNYMVPSPAEKAKYDRDYYCPMEWKIDLIDHCRLQYLADVWEAFSGHYLMPDSPPTALLDRIRKGCVSITWLVPSGLIPQLIKSVKIDTTFFQKHRILKVTVEDQCVYDEKMIDEQTPVLGMVPQKHRKRKIEDLEIDQSGAKRHGIELNGRPSQPKEEYGTDEQSTSGTSPRVLDSSCKTPPLKVDGYDCELVNPPPDILQTECSICHLVLREPQQTDCGHVFCKTCIGRVQAMNKPCPVCNAQFSTFPDKKLQRDLNQLQVQCAQNVGCDWVGMLGEFEKHLLAGCSIPCEFSYAGCMVRMSRTNTVTHMKEEQTHHIQLLAKKVKEQSRQIEEQNRQIEEQSRQLEEKNRQLEERNRQIEEKSRQLEEKNRQLEERNRQIEEQSRQIEELSMKLQRKGKEENKQAFTSEPLLLTMNTFEHRKKNDRDWYSESFYTHPRGYKLCVQVYANGSGKAKGSHVSLFTRIMKGKYDDELSWPFQGKITAELLNQNADKNHYTYDYSYDRDCKYGCRVTIGEKNYGWGCSRFISHSELDQDSDSTVQYLKDDCLKFRLYCTLDQAQ